MSRPTGSPRHGPTGWRITVEGLSGLLADSSRWKYVGFIRRYGVALVSGWDIS